MVPEVYDNETGDPEESSDIRPVHTNYEGQQLHKPIKPYVSSTQEDFTEEREFLKNVIFPEIEAVCQQRGTYFSSVNIEWRSSDPQVAAGHALSLALELIVRASPFCICMIGERYGDYRPDTLPPLPTSLDGLGPDAGWLDRNYVMAAAAGYPWLLGEAHQNCSMLELEVMQAAFLCDNDHCMFYFRQPEHIDTKYLTLPKHKRDKKLAKYLAEDEESGLRVHDLKQRIIKKGLAVKYFCSLEDLGKCVLEDWTAVIDMLYPPLLTSLHIDSEAYEEWTAQERFAESRRRLFVPNSHTKLLMETMTEFALSLPRLSDVNHTDSLSLYQTYSTTSSVSLAKTRVSGHNGEHRIVALTGDRGAGKSSIVCNWLAEFQQENPEVKVIRHYVGASPHSCNVVHFMKRCTQQLRQYFIHTESACLSSSPCGGESMSFTEQCEAFTAALSLGACVIIIDGLNQLTGSMAQTIQQIKSLSWLPDPVPAQCRVIVTTVPSDLVWKSLRARSDVHFVTAPLVDTLPTCAHYLQLRANNTFHHVQRKHLLKIWECGWKLKTKPLFLSLLASELRCHPVYTQLDTFLESLTEVVGVREFLGRCVSRWQAAHSWSLHLHPHTPGDAISSGTPDTVSTTGWVPDALRLLALSRYGLSQSDLLSLLRQLGYRGRTEVNEFDWLLFRECLGDSVYEGVGGRLLFSHQHVRECIEYALLGCVRPGIGEVSMNKRRQTDKQPDEATYHLRLAAHFSRLPDAYRQAQELPWHLLMAGEMSQLASVLSQPELFLALWDEDGKWPGSRDDLRLYWSHLRSHGYQPTPAYLCTLLAAGFQLSLDGSDSEDNMNEWEMSVVSSRLDLPPTTPPTIRVTSVPSPGADSTPRHTQSVLYSPAVSEGDRSPGRDSDLDSGTSQFRWLTRAGGPAGLDTPRDAHDSRVKRGSQGISQHTALHMAWSVAGFLSEQGETTAVENILEALRDRLLTLSPLPPEQQFLLCRAESRLGDMYVAQGLREQGETWYRCATKTLTDVTHLDDTSQFGKNVLYLKGHLLVKHGEMMERDGFDEDAEEFYEEAGDCMDVCGDLPERASVYAHLAQLKIVQENYIQAEEYLRRCLVWREEWFGQCHPLVADTIFSLARLTSLQTNNTGYNRLLSETLFRRVLLIREKCLGQNHPAVATALLYLGQLLQSNGGFSAKKDAIRLLRRSLDIRTTHFGSDHPDTKDARQYLHEVEVSVKLGQYAFGPAKPADTRTSERPYSSLSWRDHELKTKQGKSSPAQRVTPQRTAAWRSLSASSRPVSSVSRQPSSLVQQRPSVSQQPSSIVQQRPSVSRQPSSIVQQRPSLGSRPVSSVSRQPSSIRQQRSSQGSRPVSSGNRQPSSVGQQRPTVRSGTSASERSTRQEVSKGNIPVTSSKAKTILKVSGAGMVSHVSPEPVHPVSPEQVHTVKTVSLEHATATGVTQGEESGRRDVSPASSVSGDSDTDRMRVARPLSGPARLYHRYRQTQHPSSKPGRSGSAVETRSAQQLSRSNLSLYSPSFMGNASLHRKSRRGTSETLINTSQVYSLGGPNSSLSSLLTVSPNHQASQRTAQHKSAWYHVPGRYVTPTQPVPRKRSQTRPASSTVMGNQRSPCGLTVGGGVGDNFGHRDQIKLDDLEAGTDAVSMGTGDVAPSASHVVKFTGAVVVG